MNKRLRKKLMLGEFQNWLFEMSVRYDPASIPEEEIPNCIAGVMNAHGMFWGGGGGLVGDEIYGFGFNVFPNKSEREAARQALTDALRELQQRFDFEFEIEPEKVDLSKASARAPRAANQQRRTNQRLGVEEVIWEESGCASGCDCHSH